MKAKKILITSIIGAMVTCGQVLASTYVPCGSADGDSKTNCWPCGDTCTARLHNGKMTISGTGDMYNYTAVNSGGVWQSNSPWNSHRNEILSVEIKDGITSVGEQSIRAFQNMTELTIGNTVKKIGQGACYLCESLISVTIPASVENIEYEAFSRNNALENVEFETGSQLKNIGNVAFKETAIRSINIPDSVESIEQNAFFRCSNLTNIQLPKNLKFLGRTPFEDDPLGALLVPEGITDIDVDAFHTLNPDKIFCLREQLSTICNQKVKARGYYEKNADGTLSLYDRYGTLISNVSNPWIQKDIERQIHRIYTVEEATEAAKGNKNTFSIRYR